MDTKKTITVGQKKQIMRLLQFNEEAKEEVVVGITGNPACTRLSHLTFDQANKAIRKLGGKTAVDYQWAQFDKFNGQHSYVLSLCIQLGWSINHPRYGYVADLNRLSEWLKSQRSPVRKPLRAMDKAECSKIITALENIAHKNFTK